ncbi:hypothetical protein BY458DRAFT_525192 [Sporodiniella umbellata]|nr:hypothetical protein BY458DRAFT_525192 [Sporodiniella umbellata]
MAGKFLKLVVIPVTTIGLVGAFVRNQSKPAEAHSDYMKSDAKTRRDWKEANDGLSVQDVGRSGGGV